MLGKIRLKACFIASRSARVSINARTHAGLRFNLSATLPAPGTRFPASRSPLAGSPASGRDTIRVMEAAAQTRPLPGDKAARIVDAMRSSVAARGAAGSTFDHVAREAGVSRGLLHYYFGTKERLLVEVVRRDCEIRMAALDDQLAGARTADDFIDVLVRSLEDAVEHDPAFFTLMFEIFTARAAQRGDRRARWPSSPPHARAARRACCESKQREGVLDLRGGARRRRRGAVRARRRPRPVGAVGAGARPEPHAAGRSRLRARPAERRHLRRRRPVV